MTDYFDDLLDEMDAEQPTELHIDVLPPEPAELPVEQYGNQDINELVRHFEQLMQIKMSRPQKQRFAARTIIQRHTLERAMKAVDAVVACRGRLYAPQILSLEDLRDKWPKLEDYYLRLAQAPEISARQQVEGW